MKNNRILLRATVISFLLIVLALAIVLFSPSLLDIGSGTILF